MRAKDGATTQQPRAVDLRAGEPTTFAWEDEEDRRTLRAALAVAVLFHLGLMAVKLPELVAAERVLGEERRVYVVQPVRFRPPEPEPDPRIPEPRTPKVPVPDPTPDAPEPIRTERMETEIDLPDPDWIVDIPTVPPADEPAGPIQVGGDVARPVKVYAPEPRYTEIARRARIQGYVILQAIIDKRGRVTNVKVLKGLPMGLSEAAADAIKQWRFEPATLNGKPVAVYYNLTVDFELN